MTSPTSEQATQHDLWTIVVADQGGDQAEVRENEHAPLSELLHKGLKALFGEPVPNSADYVLVIAGDEQTDLSKSLVTAGLHDHAEVMILPADISMDGNWPAILRM